MAVRITELLPNPVGTDRGQEWIELCADSATSLAGYALRIGTRSIGLSGSLPAQTCRIARTGTASLRNREAEVSLLYKESPLETVRTAGTAPEGHGWHVVAGRGFWASSTPGTAPASLPTLPALPQIVTGSMVPELLGTAACTAGILTSIALAVLRHARTRHNARQGRDAEARG